MVVSESGHSGLVNGPTGKLEPRILKYYSVKSLFMVAEEETNE